MEPTTFWGKVAETLTVTLWSCLAVATVPIVVVLSPLLVIWIVYLITRWSCEWAFDKVVTWNWPNRWTVWNFAITAACGAVIGSCGGMQGVYAGLTTGLFMSVFIELIRNVKPDEYHGGSGYYPSYSRTEIPKRVVCPAATSRATWSWEGWQSHAGPDEDMLKKA